MIFSILIYFFYCALLILLPLFFYKQQHQYILMTLIFSAQFNVTCIIKAGITFSFFEIALLILFILITLESINNHKMIDWKCNAVDSIFIWFLAFSFLSMGMAFVRLTFGDLEYSKEYPMPPMLRSIMSLNKPIFYLLLIPVGNYILKKIGYFKGRILFLKYLAYSGIIPAVAVVLQWLSIGFIVIHNNPSYSENELRIMHYIGERPVGLSNEASIYCYELYFAYIGLIHCKLSRIISDRNFKLIFILFITSVILSISRTGLVTFILYTIYIYFRYSSGVGLKKLLIIILAGAVFGIILSQLNIGGFNLYERLLSTSDVEADLSTLERYGLADALISLTLNKGMILGVGIFNYFYYLKDYIPDYLTITYDYGFPLPSFNFIIQLIAEWGLPCFILFILITYHRLKNIRDRMVTEWFASLFCFALSFQILNFSLPFIIMLYPAITKKHDTQNNPFLLVKR